MSDKKYSIGEAAQRTKLTKRAIRFYDQKGLVHPAHKDENGYRLYTDKEIEELTLIAYLKKLGFTLNDIKKILDSENSSQSLHLLIRQQQENNRLEIKALQEKQKQLQRFASLLNPQEDTNYRIFDITKIMKKETSIKNYRKKLWLGAAMLFILEFGGIYTIIALTKNRNIAWAIIALVALIMLVFAIGSWMTMHYYQAVAYVCPNCKHEFVPAFKKFFFAAHTPRLRKLKCPNCQEKSYCLEVAR